MGSGHPLLGAAVLAAVERAASAHRGHRWVSQGFTSLDDRASHPCGILHGAPFSVFAKLSQGYLPPALAAGVEVVTAPLSALASASIGLPPWPATCSPPQATSSAPGRRGRRSTRAPASVTREADLALVDYFQPVPDKVFRAYRDIT